MAGLADETEWEEPGDPGAPPFYRWAALDARHALMGHAREVLPELTEVMRRSACAAQAGCPLLPECGDAGAPLLLEMLQHPQRAARASAVQQVRAQAKTSPAHAEALVHGLYEALLDPETTYDAVSEMPYLEPGVRPPPGLVERLVKRMKANPAAGTYAEACRFFAGHEAVRQAWVDMAVEGVGHAAALLHSVPLSEVEVTRLCQGILTPQLVALLGMQGERAAAAVPRLVALLPDTAACIALLRIPSGRSYAEQCVAEVFLREDDRVQKVLGQLCPSLPERVLPRLRERPPDIIVLRAVRALGAGASDQLPWLMGFLDPYIREKPLCWEAIDCIAQFGEAARPAFPALARLLDHTDFRGPALKALAVLGPVAREDFLPLLEVLELESQRWLVWQHNYWDRELTRALAALRGT